MATSTQLLPAVLFSCAAVLPVTGCTPPPAEDHYAVAVGSNTDFAGLELRSVFIVTAAENAPGRVLGTIFNTTGEEVTLVMGDRDDQLPVSIPGVGKVGFDVVQVVLRSTEAPPGARTDLTLQANGETAELGVAVVDGTLEQHAPFVPE